MKVNEQKERGDVISKLPQCDGVCEEHNRAATNCEILTKGAATKQPNLQGHLHRRAGQHYKQERNKNYKPSAALTPSSTSPADTSSKGL